MIMRYRLFGKTGLYVSELCLGSMTFGGSTGRWRAIGRLSAPEVEKLIGMAMDAGVNFFDTADVYAEGESERLLGAALSSLSTPRDRIIIATKVRARTGLGPNDIGLSRGHILSAVDASLHRLKTDYIDLYQIHGVDFDTPLEETLHALGAVVHAGKVRYVGFCNLPAWYAMKALSYADSHNLPRFVSAQMYYSIAGRDIEREIVPLAQEEGLAVMPWSPLAGGLLSGKFDLENPGPENARRSTFDFPPVDRVRAKALLGVMRPIAERLGMSVARVALAWMLTRRFVTSIIIGAKTVAQLADNLASTEVVLAAEDIARLDEASKLPLEYPGWMLDWQHQDRRPEKIFP